MSGRTYYVKCRVCYCPQIREHYASPASFFNTARPSSNWIVGSHFNIVRAFELSARACAGSSRSASVTVGPPIIATMSFTLRFLPAPILKTSPPPTVLCAARIFACTTSRTCVKSRECVPSPQIVSGFPSFFCFLLIQIFPARLMEIHNNHSCIL